MKDHRKLSRLVRNLKPGDKFEFGYGKRTVIVDHLGETRCSLFGNSKIQAIWLTSSADSFRDVSVVYLFTDDRLDIFRPTTEVN